MSVAFLGLPSREQRDERATAILRKAASIGVRVKVEREGVCGLRVIATRAALDVLLQRDLS